MNQKSIILGMCLSAVLVLFINLNTPIFKKSKTTSELVQEVLINVKEEPAHLNINKLIESLPKEILYVILSNNIKIELTDVLGAKSEYGNIASMYIYDDSLIKIHSKYSNESVLYHEIGHAFSYLRFPIIKVSDLGSFKDIYLEEKDLIFPDGGKVDCENFILHNEYLKSTGEEYFAQSLSMYLTNTLPKDTKTYKFFQSLISI